MCDIIHQSSSASLQDIDLDITASADEGELGKLLSQIFHLVSHLDLVEE